MVKSQFGQLEKSRMPKVGGWREIAAPSGEVPWDLIHEWGETDWCGDDLEAVPICCGEESWEWQRSCQFTGRSAILLSPVEWGTRNRNASPSSKGANWGGLGIRLGIPPGYLLGEVFRVIPTRRPRWRDCISLLAWGCFFFSPWMSWKRCLKRRKSGHLCLQCRVQEDDKWKMDGWISLNKFVNTAKWGYGAVYRDWDVHVTLYQNVQFKKYRTGKDWN